VSQPVARMRGHDDKHNISAYSTDRIMSGYSAPLRQYLIAGHYMETLAFHTRASRGGGVGTVRNA
jgi:hypothetical protein